MALRDYKLILAAAQAIPVDANADASENYLEAAVAAPAFNVGTPVHVVIQVDTSFAIAAGAPTLTIDLYTDTDSTVVGGTFVQRLIVLPATAAAGDRYRITLDQAAIAALKKYIAAVLTPSSDEFTAGAVSIWFEID